MRIGVGQPGAGERLLENSPDGRGIGPMRAREAARLEQVILILHDLGCRKQRIDGAEQRSVARYFTQSTTIWRTSSPTGKNHVENVFENLVRTSRASCTTLPSTTSTCLHFREAIAPSRAPVSAVKATTDRLRSSISLPAGMVCSTCRICSMVGTGRSAIALAIRASRSDKAKYSASAEERCER